MHASLTGQCPHSVHKQIKLRALRRVNGDKLDADLTSIETDTGCGDVNTVVIQCDDCMRKLLDSVLTSCCDNNSIKPRESIMIKVMAK